MALGSVGIKTYIWNNNIISIMLLVMFPALLMILLGLFFFIMGYYNNTQMMDGYKTDPADFAVANVSAYWHYAIIAASAWFLVSFGFHGLMVNFITRARSVSRLEHPQLYNLLENLCISRGIVMPDLQIIESPALNAFASGLFEKDFAITVTTGLIETLNDEELEAVLAHELTHIINRDVRILIVSLVFVGMISTLADLAWRGIRYIGRGDGKDGSKAKVMVLAAAVVLSIGYLFSIIIRFGLSRKREYMADAGAVELTKNPQAMISALGKIAGRSEIENIPADYKEMMFDNPKMGFLGLFATHPPIERRLEALRSFL